jgi:hypothetical protein
LLRIIVGELSHGKPFLPIILLVVNKASEVLFQNGVRAFRLAIRLRVMSCGQLSLYFEIGKHMLPKFGDKLRASIRDHFRG